MEPFCLQVDNIAPSKSIKDGIDTCIGIFWRIPTLAYGVQLTSWKLKMRISIKRLLNNKLWDGEKLREDVIVGMEKGPDKGYIVEEELRFDNHWVFCRERNWVKIVLALSFQLTLGFGPTVHKLHAAVQSISSLGRRGC